MMSATETRTDDHHVTNVAWGRLQIGRDDLANLAWSHLRILLDEELSKNNPELGSIAEAELCVGFMKAIAHKCTRIEIAIARDSIVSVSEGEGTA